MQFATFAGQDRQLLSEHLVLHLDPLKIGFFADRCEIYSARFTFDISDWCRWCLLFEGEYMTEQSADTCKGLVYKVGLRPSTAVARQACRQAAESDELAGYAS